jgi:hypothetical protein
MEPLDDLPLDRGHGTVEPPAPRRESRRAVVVVALLVAAAVAVVAIVVWRRTPPARETGAPAAAAPRAAAERKPLGPEVAPLELPPLDLSDPLVRQLLGQLSSRPELAAWLATDGLIRTFVASLDNVASGATPVRHLRVLAPAEPFEADGAGPRLVISARSYRRYDGIADTVASIDPAALARVHSALKPRLEEAYIELGHPAGHIDAAVERAIVVLLQTPLPEGPVALRHGIASFEFERDAFESLSAAQKQLLRMGPRNVRLIQGQLWALARELGIPSERLPAPAVR